jgi:hypothetical protein
MQIPPIPDYNSITLSGCCLKRANFYGRKREYTSEVDYNIITLPIMSVFDFAVVKYWGIQHNFPISHKRMLLSIDYDIDYDSFISLN